ncbi:MAG: 50S ribosomal protein L13 [Bacteriovoracaceae bacterium]|nr:50S ribosomal protein L13 [Bacteriovoracaceae bacterium]
MYTQKSFVLKPADSDKKWYVIDATDKIVGRVATEIANLLRGKNNPMFTPHTDSGDFVVVVNAEKIKFTGKKLTDKKYYSHSKHVGGLKVRTAGEILEKHPTRILMSAVKGMLPKTSLGRKQLTKFKVFAGPEHEHAAQNPVAFEIK